MLRLITTAFAAAFVLAATGLASAADMTKATAKDAFASAGPTWAGFYIGAHAGYGFGNIKPNADALQVELGNFDPKGVVFGGHIGHNWQYGNLVSGVEIDATWLNAKDSVTGAVADCKYGCSASGKFDFIGTARGRLGFANGSWLFYGTGGLAWAHSSVSSVETTKPAFLLIPSTTVSEAIANTQFGWVAGAGIEAMLSQHWTVRVEGLHYSFSRDVASKADLNVIRAGVNLKF